MKAIWSLTSLSVLLLLCCPIPSRSYPTKYDKSKFGEKFNMGMSLFTNGEYGEEAIKYFTESIEDGEDEDSSYWYRGMTYQMMGNKYFKKAEDDWIQSYQIKNSGTTGFNNFSMTERSFRVARFLAKSKKCKESKNTFLNGLDLLGGGTYYNGYRWEYHFDYAQNCEINPSSRISEYQEALKYYNNDRAKSMTLLNIGYEYKDLNDLDNACLNWRKSSKVSSQWGFSPDGSRKNIYNICKKREIEKRRNDPYWSPIKNIPQENLDQICMIGPLMNSQRNDGKRSGYAMYIGQGKLAVDDDWTQQDFNEFRSYIMKNCSGAW